MVIRNASNLNGVEKRASIWNINPSLRMKYPAISCRSTLTNLMCLPWTFLCRNGFWGSRVLLQIAWIWTQKMTLSACPSFLHCKRPTVFDLHPYCTFSFYLIFRSRVRFSLSLFLRISMNWLKKCSWSFFFWTSRNRWSRPYFSANSLNVVLWEKHNQTYGMLHSQVFRAQHPS